MHSKNHFFWRFRGNDIEINKQIKALKKTLLFFEPKKIIKK